MFQLEILVGAEHLDELGHVNNITYLQWMQDIAWAHSRHLGLGLAAYQQLDAAMVARQHELTYLAACFAGDELLLTTWLSKNDGFNLYRHYEISRKSDQKKVFEARTHWVCIRMSSGRPIRMPPEFKKAYIVS
ncbi:acyl-CoA thioesterase [Alkanindiges sp. WGS2144]|uniref:acyl-CoA thioesterase n=1 Tax=Alkanindiges sp. WGS2144 TaxID=3366808 RepID=UPI00375234DE